ncbi:maleylpyruvate isomerase N-terminal domain-containing protein [Micromonospora sp. C32]|uniref:maleylpyruvate isomerase N-terminal domain-containing protein n=1 Tax=unclassified Micromonospora TaxID=2617518 RepID=UPI001B362680|nr:MULTISPECIES: maleylpyruvate isomerase N-terminal domain-containing protein [unclassified Micromonospora]MBQ1041191.1 maleylpyruvate isomerase N-terminal domain-containing protein [Micromonospora sp. C72]MBQ1055009.1 maleylpyruvate isomerase N-terminal domain-containing protein [Micromonospora sp. C32]
MSEPLTFPDRLRLIDDRSAAFRDAVAAAPDLDAPVPTCPEWTLFDLARHIGEGRRSWAATVAAGPEASGRAAPGGPGAPRERTALRDWLAESTEQLLAALREAGPDRGCWTWWDTSQSPQNCGAVARHQLQEIAVHTYDAQLTVGAPQPLPVEVALDGVEDFLFTCCATTVAWPHEPAFLDYHLAEGGWWRVRLSPGGARVTRMEAGEDASPADTAARSTAGDLVLAFYGRIPLDALAIEGDRRVLDRIAAWDPDA